MILNKKVMLIEDDEIDVMTVKRALVELKSENSLIVAENGEIALNLLSEYKLKPFLIILDLNMSRMSGLEFLKNVKKDINLKKIPIIVFTTSKDEQDIIESYNLGAAGYIIKPVEYSKYVEALRIVDLYWSLCKLPD